MHRIIYTADTPIEWDAQSAFKLTNYYTSSENHMVFCYLKQYVQSGALKLCTYCFDSEAAGKEDLELCFNLNPEHCRKFVGMRFGIDGICSFEIFDEGLNSNSKYCVASSAIQYHTYKANDQQGYYWCGEITIPPEFTQQIFGTFLKEKSIIALNMYKIFENSTDHASLFADSEASIKSKGESMQEFVVLKY